MKIFLAQQNYHIGNFEANTKHIIDAIDQAKAAGAELAVFTELSVCGYPPRDFLEFEDFILQCEASIEKIKAHTSDIAVIVGAPARNPRAEGKDLFNAAWFLYENEVKGIVHKTLLPTYDVFDEYRYFEPAFEWNLISFKGKKIALTICEDIWNLGDNPLYRICPMDELMKQQPDLMINISASPFDYDHDEDRKEVVRLNCLKYKLPMFYCNAVGSQTEIVFDGGSLVCDAAGNIVKEMKYFEEDYFLVESSELGGMSRESVVGSRESTAGSQQPEGMSRESGVGSQESTAGCTQSGVGSREPGVNSRESTAGSQQPGVHSRESGVGSQQPGTVTLEKDMRVKRIKDPHMIIPYLTAEHNIEQIHAALILGIKDYFFKMGFKKAILGSSGGIDSAVTLALACEALGAENVRAVLMPSHFSTSHSVDDAIALSKNLDNPYDIIPIKDVYDSFLDALSPVFKDLPFGIAEENIQSRTRGNLLMAISNKFGYILLNTSNKSELATGYGTLYGDMAGGLSVLGDVYKMQVFALAEYINRKKEIIPKNIISKPPSAELRPNQKDSDSLPDYSVLDKVLFQYIERRQGPKEIIALGIDEALVQRVLKLVNTNEYKRNQFCPIIRVSTKAFGVGRRMPIVGKYLS